MTQTCSPINCRFCTTHMLCGVCLTIIICSFRATIGASRSNFCKQSTMAMLQEKLSENPCYGSTSNGIGYLEFSCIYGVENYYGR